MKLLLDQGLPRSAAHLLRELGFDALYVGEMGYAVAEADKPSVIRVRIEGLKAQVVVKLLAVVIEQCHQDLELGAAVTVQEKQIRIRRLPLR